MKTHRQQGFTLWELLVTLLVAGVLFGIGLPNIMEFQRAGLVTDATNDLVTALLTARTEAIKRQVPVTLCLSDDPLADPPTCEQAAVANSTRGFFVWVDENGDLDALGNPDLSDATDGNAVVDGGETVILRGEVLSADAPLRLSTTCGHVAYGPNGWPRAVTGCSVAWGTQQFFLFCDDRGRRASAGQLSSARMVRVEPTGRGVVLQETGQINPNIAATGGTCP